MAKFSGQDFRIKIRVSTGPDVYTAIAGFRSDGMTLNNEAIDVTDKDYDGLEAIITLHIGSQYRGTKEIRTWMDKAHSLLHDASLTLTTEQGVLCRFLRSEIVTDSDGITRHGVMRFSLLINEVS